MPCGDITPSDGTFMWFFMTSESAPVDQCRNLLYDTQKRLLDSLFKKDTSHFTFMYKIERSIPVRQETAQLGVMELES